MQYLAQKYANFYILPDHKKTTTSLEMQLSSFTFTENES